MCMSKPMLHEEIEQLKRSLLSEIAAHDKTKRRLAAQEMEIERMRSTLYRDPAEKKGEEEEKPTEGIRCPACRGPVTVGKRAFCESCLDAARKALEASGLTQGKDQCWICGNPASEPDEKSPKCGDGHDNWITLRHDGHLWCLDCLRKHANEYSHRYCVPGYKDHDSNSTYKGAPIYGG